MKFFGVAIVALAALVLTYRALLPSVTVRYRLTIDAELDGRRSTGSGIIQVTYAKNLRLLGASANIHVGIDGEAVPVDLGDGRLVVALLSSGQYARSDPEWVIPGVFGVKGGAKPETFGEINALTGQRDISNEWWPLVVYFRNSLDPTSVEFLNPTSVSTPLNGMPRIVDVKIEIVDSGVWPLRNVNITGTPITHSIFQYLPWLVAATEQRRLALILTNKKFPSGSDRQILSLFKRGV